MWRVTHQPRRTDPQEDITTKEESFDCSALGLSITCMGSVKGNLVEMLVNTGSVYTLINEELWTTFAQELRKPMDNGMQQVAAIPCPWI